jgi:hypothetical protein
MEGVEGRLKSLVLAEVELQLASSGRQGPEGVVRKGVLVFGKVFLKEVRVDDSGKGGAFSEVTVNNSPISAGLQEKSRRLQ